MINRCLKIFLKVARGLEIELERLGTEESYFKSLPKQLESKRDYMAKFLVLYFKYVLLFN